MQQHQQGKPGDGAAAKKKRARKAKAAATSVGVTVPVVADEASRVASLQSGNALVDEVLRQTVALSLTRAKVEQTVSRMFEEGGRYDDVDAVVSLLFEAAGVVPDKPAPRSTPAVTKVCVRPFPFAVLVKRWSTMCMCSCRTQFR